MATFAAAADDVVKTQTSSSSTSSSTQLNTCSPPQPLPPPGCPYHHHHHDHAATNAPSRSNTSASYNSNNEKPIHICVKLTAAALFIAASTASYYAYKYLKNRRQSKSSQQSTLRSTSTSPSQDTSKSIVSPNSRRTQSVSESRLIRIGTRTSQLAMYQANLVQTLLKEQSINGDENPITLGNQSQIEHCKFQVCGINTTGDIDQIKPLTAFDNKGVFTKELDIALLQGRLEIAVHCLKDLPTILPDGLVIGATLRRGQTADALVVHSRHLKAHADCHAHSRTSIIPPFTLSDLPHSSVIGTSALRRRAAIARSHPHLICKDIRGNVLTRLSKLDHGDFDAIILAAVGLERLELHQRIASTLDESIYGYAVGQGTLAILCRESDSYHIRMVEKLQDAHSRLRGDCERSLLRTLQGGCKVPIQVRSTIHNNTRQLELWTAVLSIDGTKHVETTIATTLSSIDCSKSTLAEAVALGAKVGNFLLANGADAILNDIR